MNWYNLYKNRLVLAGSWVENVAFSGDLLKNYISFEHEEALRMEILQRLNTNYSDRELYDLKNQLDVLFLLKDFNYHQLQIKNLSETALVEKVGNIGTFVIQLEQGIEDRLQQIISLADMSLMEMCFHDLKKEYQKLLIFKALKSKILSQLVVYNSPLAQLAHLFNDF
jgi:flagellar biosynthesis chaperone FliJ